MKLVRLPTVVLFALLATSCAARGGRSRPTRDPSPVLARVEFTIQLGAFADPENASRLLRSLAERGVEAFYYAEDGGLLRVRFGSFPSERAAEARAQALADQGVIGEFFVVAPRTGPFAKGTALRGELVHSALALLGRPYRWGGSSAETGLDCSGLTMAVYRRSGLLLPRAAAEQLAEGRPVATDRLQPADLVFFRMDDRAKPRHVGLYLGDGRFIHAPSSGSVVRVDALSDEYYRRRLVGARSYVPD